MVWRMIERWWIARCGVGNETTVMASFVWSLKKRRSDGEYLGVKNVLLCWWTVDFLWVRSWRHRVVGRPTCWCDAGTWAPINTCSTTHDEQRQRKGSMPALLCMPKVAFFFNNYCCLQILSPQAAALHECNKESNKSVSFHKDIRVKKILDLFF